MIFAGQDCDDIRALLTNTPEHTHLLLARALKAQFHSRLSKSTRRRKQESVYKSNSTLLVHGCGWLYPPASENLLDDFVPYMETLSDKRGQRRRKRRRRDCSLYCSTWSMTYPKNIITQQEAIERSSSRRARNHTEKRNRRTV